MGTRTFVKALFVFAILIEAGSAFAASSSFEVSGWLPYWRKATSTADAMLHLNQLTEINPFGYSVKSDGTLADTMKIDEAPWPALIAAAKAQKVRVIPTIMWSNGDAIHRILSNSTTRIALEDEIANLVKEKGFDGIDIDFEGKKAETKDYFSTFLKGLYQRMGNKWVMCDIEARTPLDSRYDGTPPPDATTYANDYVAINKYCDRVKIMAYDQGTIDVKLNAAQQNAPYIPVSDPAWVTKVVNLTAKTISKKKIMIGVPTYGYEYEVTPLSQQGYRYSLLWAFNQQYAYDLISKYQVSVKRNAAGELSFSYLPSLLPTDTLAINSGTATTDPSLNNAPPPPTTNGQVAGVALPSFNIAWWSDARAIQDKYNLAKKLGVRGISMFKIDGGEDPSVWNILPKVR